MLTPEQIKVKELRQQTGLSQQKFADKFGIPVATLQTWEHGVNKPLSYSVNMIERILQLEAEIIQLRKEQV